MKTWAFILTVLVSFVLLGAGRLASLSPSDSPPAGQGPRMSESFKLLRSPQELTHTDADRRSFEAASLAGPHVEFEVTQRVAKHDSLWVLATDRLLCVAQPRGAACAPKSAALKHGVPLGTFRPPTADHPVPHDFVLQGVAPDGVRKVLVVIGKDRQFVADVKRNIFSVERDEPVHLKELLSD
jgi:hypothetical protein